MRAIKVMTSSSAHMFQLATVVVSFVKLAAARDQAFAIQDTIPLHNTDTCVGWIHLKLPVYTWQQTTSTTTGVSIATVNLHRKQQWIILGVFLSFAKRRLCSGDIARKPASDIKWHFPAVVLQCFATVRCNWSVDTTKKGRRARSTYAKLIALCFDGQFETETIRMRG